MAVTYRRHPVPDLLEKRKNRHPREKIDIMEVDDIQLRQKRKQLTVKPKGCLMTLRAACRRSKRDKFDAFPNPAG